MEAFQVAMASVESPGQSEPVVPAKHGWQGVLYYCLTYVGAVVLGVGAMAIAVIIFAGGDNGAAALVAFLLLAGLAAMSFLVARGIQRFESWARVVALTFAYPSALSGFLATVRAADGAERIGGLASGVLFVVFIVYFHGAKDLFDLVHASRKVPPGGGAGSHRTDIL